MPLIDQDDDIKGLGTPAETPLFNQKPEESDQDNPSVGQTIGASFRQFNPEYSAISHGTVGKIDSAYNPNYHPYDDIKNTKYESQWEKFQNSNSPQETDQIKTQIDQDQKDQQILMGSGVTGVLSATAASIISPMTLLGGLAGYRAATGIGEMLTNPLIKRGVLGGLSFGGASIFGNAINPTMSEGSKLKSDLESAGFGSVVGPIGAMYGRAAAAGTGATLMGLQSLAAPNASMAVTAANAVLGGIFGGALGVKDPALDAMRNTVANMVYTGKPGEIQIKPTSAGAMEAHIIQDAQISGINPKIARVVSPWGIRAPVIEGLTSTSPYLRDLTSRFFETDLVLNMNKAEGEKAGTPTPISIQTAMKADQIKNNAFNNYMNEAYLKYLKVEDGKFRGARAVVAARQQNKLTFAQFNEEVAKASRNFDQHEIPEVAQVAKFGRKYIDDATAQMRAKEIPSKEFWDQVDKDKADRGEANSYLTRVYDVQKIMADRSSFEEALAKDYIKQGVDPSEASEKAMGATDSVLGMGDDRVGLSDIVPIALDRGIKFTKERSIGVSSESVIEPWLKNDYSHIVNQYLSQSSRLLRNKDFLDSIGAESFADIRKGLKSEYDKQLIQNPDMSEKLTKDFKGNLDLLNDFIAMSNGQFMHRTNADKAIGIFKAYQYVRLMGGFALTALPHAGAMVIRQGFGRMLEDGLFREFGNFFNDVRGMNKDDLNAMNIGIQQHMNNALRTIIDPSFIEPGTSPIEKTLSHVEDLFSKISGINKFIDTSKKIAGNVTMIRLMKDLQGYDKLPDEEKTYLNSMHIGKDDVAPILAQFDKYGATEKGQPIANTQFWSDAAAKEKFISAMINEVDSMVPTPGQGDIPRVVQKYATARLLFMFKGFFSGVTSRILMSGLQKQDANVVSGVATMIALGATSYLLHTAASGKEIDRSPQNLVMEGMARSGFLGLLNDPLFGFALSPLHLRAGQTRYTDTNAVEYIGGPTASWLNQVWTLGRDIETGSIFDKTYSKDVKYAEALIPMQNLFYLQILLHKFNQSIGVKEKTKK